MFEAVISLGHRCYTAQHLRRMMIHGGTMPLDWVISSNAGAADAIRSGFSGMFQSAMLEFGGDHIRDHRFGFMHVHDLPLKVDFMAHRDAAVDRYALLIRRLLDALSSSQRILFVRHEEPGVGGAEAAMRISEAIGRWRDPSSFHLLHMTETDAESGNSLPAHVTQIKINGDAGEDAATWDGIFSSMHRRERIRAYFPALVKHVDAMPNRIKRPAHKFLGNSRRGALMLRSYLG